MKKSNGYVIYSDAILRRQTANLCNPRDDKITSSATIGSASPRPASGQFFLLSIISWSPDTSYNVKGGEVTHIKEQNGLRDA